MVTSLFSILTNFFARPVKNAMYRSPESLGESNLRVAFEPGLRLGVTTVRVGKALTRRFGLESGHEVINGAAKLKISFRPRGICNTVDC